MKIKQLKKQEKTEQAVRRLRASLIACWVAQPLVAAAVSAAVVWCFAR